MRRRRSGLDTVNQAATAGPGLDSGGDGLRVKCAVLVANTRKVRKAWRPFSRTRMSHSRLACELDYEQ